ncbi:MAG: GNAT family N-acetyltransferase [Anaerolineae bacterium]|nr:GNAT family N-acetyltransferase [Anaerolineae bacterium]
MSAAIQRSDLVIRPFRPADAQAIEDIAAAAWTPIYAHFAYLQEQALGEVARRSSVENKREQVRSFARDHPGWTLVSEVGGRVVGFITFTLDRERRIGTIGNNAVDPEFCGRGIGSAQYRAVLDVFRREGMRFATVVTGLDEAHAAARRAYEKVGFVPVLSSVEYMMKL